MEGGGPTRVARRPSGAWIRRRGAPFAPKAARLGPRRETHVTSTAPASTSVRAPAAPSPAGSRTMDEHCRSRRPGGARTRNAAPPGAQGTAVAARRRDQAFTAPQYGPRSTRSFRHRPAQASERLVRHLMGIPDLPTMIISILGMADDRSAGAGFMLFPRSIRSEAVWWTIDEARAGNRRSAEVRWSIDGPARGAKPGCAAALLEPGALPPRIRIRPLASGARRTAPAPRPCAARTARCARREHPPASGGIASPRTPAASSIEGFETAREEMVNGTAPGAASERSRRFAL